MNDADDADRDDSAPNPAQDPGEDARIRALLAELGSGPDGEPIPPEVAARLDETLALLVAERGGTGTTDDESTSGTVVPLRRRWLPRATAAAAAVIVLGAGSVAVANFRLLDGMSPAEQNSSADSAAESAPQTTPETTAGSPDSGSGSSSDSGKGAVALPELSSASFASDVAILLEGGAPVLTPEGEAGGELPPQKSRENAESGAPGALTSRACPGPQITDGAVANQVRYDGALAVLVIHPERAGRQVVEAWNCAGDRRLASTTISP